MIRKRVLVATDDDWRTRAACAERRVDPRWFGPQPKGAGAVIAQAVAVCRGCPVVEPCRRAGETDRYAHGVYGGRYFHRGPGRPKRT